MKSKVKNVFTIGLSFLLGVCITLVCFFSFNTNDLNDLDSNQQESIGTENESTDNNHSINGIYYATPTEDTGASEADSKEQGGALFVGNGSTISLSENASITDHMGKYGGAVYVANGGTFNMTGGTITGNYAKYGGAIYIESGGVCNLSSGTIEVNEAESGTAIYVEDGGELNITGDVSITGNIEGEWGYLIFDGVRYRNFVDFYEIYDTINPDNYESFNYDIYGTVYHQYFVRTSGTENPAYTNGLNFGTDKDVYITGCYEEYNTDDIPNIVVKQETEIAYKLRANNSDFYISNIVFDDLRTKNYAWEHSYIEPFCTNFYATNCTFNNGVTLQQVVNSDITNCVFNSINSSRYALWIGANGYSSYKDYKDYLENCKIEDCVFNGYRAIKILSVGATIYMENVDFVGISKKSAIQYDVNYAIDIKNNLTLYNVNFIDCAYDPIALNDNLQYLNISLSYNLKYNYDSSRTYEVLQSSSSSLVYNGDTCIGFLYFYENPEMMDIFVATRVWGDSKYGDVCIYGTNDVVLYEYRSGEY